MGGFFGPVSSAAVSSAPLVVARDTQASAVALGTGANQTLATLTLPVLPPKASFRVTVGLSWFTATGQSVTIGSTLTDHAANTLICNCAVAGFKAGSPFYGGGSYEAIYQDLGITPPNTPNGQIAHGKVAMHNPPYNSALATVVSVAASQNSAVSTLDLTQASTLTVYWNAALLSSGGGDYFYTIVELLNAA